MASINSLAGLHWLYWLYCFYPLIMPSIKMAHFNALISTWPLTGRNKILLEPYITSSMRRYRTYSNASERLSMKYPHDWDIIEREKNSIAVFLSPLESKDDSFRENLTLMRKEVNFETKLLEAFVDLQVSQLREGFLDFSLLDRGSTKIAGQQGQYITYQGKREEVKLKVRQFFFMKGASVYILTYTGEQGHFEYFSTDVKKMVKSIEIEWILAFIPHPTSHSCSICAFPNRSLP